MKRILIHDGRPPPQKKKNKRGGNGILSRRIEASVLPVFHWIRVLNTEWANFLWLFRPNMYMFKIHCLHKPNYIPILWRPPQHIWFKPSAPLAYSLLEICPSEPPLGISRIPPPPPPPPTPFWVTTTPPLQYLNTSLFLNFPPVPFSIFFSNFSDHPCLISYSSLILIPPNLTHFFPFIRYQSTSQNTGDKKNPGKCRWLDKVISEIPKPLKMVLCSSREIV